MSTEAAIITPLVLGSELPGRPVVACDCGDDIAEVRDVVFDPISHRLVGFTLNKRGWFRGTLKESLPASVIGAIGPVAIMVATSHDLVDVSDAPAALEQVGSDGISISGTTVLSAGGEQLGTITDVVIETGPTPEAVGYQVTTDDGAIFVPISAQLALSENNLLLPENATVFIRNDLAGFGAAVTNYRELLEETQ